jgi:hypothetical protein
MPEVLVSAGLMIRTFQSIRAIAASMALIVGASAFREACASCGCKASAWMGRVPFTIGLAGCRA